MGWSEIVAGVIGVLLGAVLRPYAERLFPAPGRMNGVRQEVERAWADHRTWVERNESGMRTELARVDEDFAGRGIYDSGARMDAHAAVRQRYVDELTDHQRKALRVTQDAFARLGPLERLWVRRRAKKGGPPDASVEEQLFRT